jgi:hypothetical protein
VQQGGINPKHNCWGGRLLLLLLLWPFSKTHKFQSKKKKRAAFATKKVSQVQLDLEEFREIALLGFLKVVARIAESEKRAKFS